MARRFIVENDDIKELENELYEISGKEVKHIQVLRINVEEEVTINQNIYSIVEIKKDRIIVKYIKDAPICGVPKKDITLYIAMLKNDKMDYVVQKAVEIGVKKIIPFFSSNVVVKLDEKTRNKRIMKLQTIANEACKQCGRTDLVEIGEFISFKELENKVEDHEICLFAYEESQGSFRKEIEGIKNNDNKDIACVVGSEGGFTPAEADSLNNISSVKTISLGERILRAETAVFKILSVLIYEVEE